MRLAPEKEKLNRSLNDGYLTSAQVCRQLGISMRQLQWWDERKVLRPARTEWHRRLYSPENVSHLRKLAALRKAGVSLQQIRNRKYLTLSFSSVLRVTKPQMIGDVLVVPR